MVFESVGECECGDDMAWDQGSYPKKSSRLRDFQSLLSYTPGTARFLQIVSFMNSAFANSWWIQTCSEKCLINHSTSTTKGSAGWADLPWAVRSGDLAGGADCHPVRASGRLCRLLPVLLLLPWWLTLPTPIGRWCYNKMTVTYDTVCDLYFISEDSGHFI